MVGVLLLLLLLLLLLPLLLYTKPLCIVVSLLRPLLLLLLLLWPLQLLLFMLLLLPRGLQFHLQGRQQRGGGLHTHEDAYAVRVLLLHHVCAHQGLWRRVGPCCCRRGCRCLSEACRRMLRALLRTQTGLCSTAFSTGSSLLVGDWLHALLPLMLLSCILGGSSRIDDGSY
jgi:hypothetical protein